MNVDVVPDPRVAEVIRPFFQGYPDGKRTRKSPECRPASSSRLRNRPSTSIYNTITRQVKSLKMLGDSFRRSASLVL